MASGLGSCRGLRAGHAGTGGPLGTWEILSSPPEMRSGEPNPKSPGPGERVPGHRGSERRGTGRYRDAEGNEAERDGRQEVRAPA